MDRVYTDIFYAIHGDVNITSHVGILPSYYLQRLVKFPLGLSSCFRLEL
jgi:hypothetical protein